MIQKNHAGTEKGWYLVSFHAAVHPVFGKRGIFVNHETNSSAFCIDLQVEVFIVCYDAVSLFQ